MRYDLFDYQREAAIEVLKRLGRGRADWAEHESLSAFALSAVTGAGKTVIATAVIEAMLDGSADLGFTGDPRALFLWVTDDPALNRQTRNSMLESSDLLAPGQLQVLGDDFVDPSLQRRKVYFLNVQQLSRSAGFAQGGVNRREMSGWEVIGNTIRAEDRDLYLVLDEAHRGMKRATDRSSIVRRIIGGQRGSNPAAPVVWGISATIDRFSAAMHEHEGSRTSYPPVAVDLDKVRASGIVKDQIDLDEPDEMGSFSTTLLRAAVDTALDFEQRWAAYAEAEGEPLVLPVLVVQVADKPTEGALAELVSVIDQQWLGLGPRSVVNVFGEHDDLVLGSRSARWVPPESIQDDQAIRVVLAKQAISTGWDCPRAEVLYSERPASDATHIAQVIGRMVRSPLAHRIATDDALNAVSCFLPRFNRAALTRVIDELTRPGEAGAAAEVVINARLFERNPHVDPGVFPFVEALPSWPRPDALASPFRRAKTLAKLLTDTSSGSALLPDAGERLTNALNAKLDGLMAEHDGTVNRNVRDIETAEIRQTSFEPSTGEILETRKRSIRTAARDIDRDTRRVIGSVREGVAKDYVKHRVDKADGSADVLDVRTRVAALLLIDGVIAEVERAATRWVQKQYGAFGVEITNTTGATRDAYLKVKEQTSEQEETSIELTVTLKAPTKEAKKTDPKDLPTFAKHLYADVEGNFPAALNDWEMRVITTETARPSTVAWYRNPSRAASSALRIGYPTDAHGWGSLQVDFIIVSRRDDGSLGASIVDPHGDHLADAKAKLRGLARYAERFGDRFVRIQAIGSGTDGLLRTLEMRDAHVREAVRAFEGGKVTALFDSDLAVHYQ